MASLEECHNFVRHPGEEDEEVAVSDPRWGPIDDEGLGYLLRRIDFQKIIDFHIKDLKHTLVKHESLIKKLKDTVSGLQGELTTTKTTCEQQQVQNSLLGEYSTPENMPHEVEMVEKGGPP